MPHWTEHTWACQLCQLALIVYKGKAKQRRRWNLFHWTASFKEKELNLLRRGGFTAVAIRKRLQTTTWLKKTTCSNNRTWDFLWALGMGVCVLEGDQEEMLAYISSLWIRACDKWALESERWIQAAHLSTKAAVTKLSDLTNHHWSKDHRLVTATLENFTPYTYQPLLSTQRGWVSFLRSGF